MHLAIHVDPRDSTPLWKQIEERVRWLVTSRGILPGDPVPSVRDLARELRINPATVVRAYQHLTDDGLLVVRRGEGTFVSEKPPVVEKSERTRMVREAAQKFATAAASAGASQEEALREVAAAWRNLETTGRGERK